MLPLYTYREPIRMYAMCMYVQAGGVGGVGYGGDLDTAVTNPLEMKNSYETVHFENDFENVPIFTHNLYNEEIYLLTSINKITLLQHFQQSMDLHDFHNN